MVVTNPVNPVLWLLQQMAGGGSKAAPKKSGGGVTMVGPSTSRAPVTSLGTGVVRGDDGSIYSIPPSYGSSGGGASYGGGGGGGYSAASPVAPPPMSDDDWLAADAGYLGSIKALEQKLRDFEVENESTRKKGIQDYDDSLLRLGWMKDANNWNQEDRTTAYGNAYQGQMGDFASRGLLQSTLYDQARTDMLGNFNRQKGDMDTSHTNFIEELQRALTGKRTDTQLGKDQARVEALARRAAAESGMG